MTRAELEQAIVVACRESGLADGEQMSALARARQRLQKGTRLLSPVGLHGKKNFKPLARPSGKIMGKQKREAKE